MDVIFHKDFTTCIKYASYNIVIIFKARTNYLQTIKPKTSNKLLLENLHLIYLRNSTYFINLGRPLNSSKSRKEGFSFF